MSKKTLILGASTSAYRYSFMAANRLHSSGHSLVLVGKRKDEWNGITIWDRWPKDVNDVDTITVYLAPENQHTYYDDIANSGVKRLIFNPGSENAELEGIARSAGIEVIEACTLIMLSSNQY